MSKNKSPAKAVCNKCGLPARRVASVMREVSEGDLAAVFIVERQFIHVAENGQKMICLEKLEYPWLMTLCGVDELEGVRQKLAKNAVKWQTGFRAIIGAVPR
ncbi:MAG: hypothetical protein GY769_04450 [bacterium]|nr:hypothetical protein [bacterium]